MRYISIDKVNPGDVLAKDIIDNHGNILLKASMNIKENMIPLLKTREINGLYIADKISEDLFIEEAIPLSVRNLAIQALETKDIKQTEVIAKQIVDSFKSDIEIDLNRMIDGVNYYEKTLNICELCLSLGKKLNYTDDSLNKLVTTALLSKISLIMTNEEREKIIDDGLLKLKTILLQRNTDEIYPILSRFVASNANMDAMVVHSVYYHKENEDGTGLVQDFYKQLNILNHPCDIRDTAKIVHICSDYVDCLIKENNFEKARDMIQAGIIDKKYNYDLASVFLKFIPIYPIGTIVNLSNGENAIVIKNNNGNPTLPVIKLETGEIIDLTETLNIVINGINNKIEAFQK